MSKTVSECDRIFESIWPCVTERLNEELMILFGCAKGDECIKDINSKNIVLIPKINSPNNMSQIRSISLCNVIYKIVSKVLVNRFKKVLNLCIDENQGAFMPGRQITNNILVACEILHSFKKKEGSIGSFALKLDMSKAYDRVEWSFIEQMLQRMGFCNDWINLIMRCVTTISYSVMLNEGFSKLITRAKGEGLIKGAKLGKSGLAIKHLFFANDNILFGKETEERARAMKEVVSYYEKVSGQLINFDKSLIYFSSNTGIDNQEQVRRFFGVKIANNPKKYLGLQTMVGRRKRHIFGGVTQLQTRAHIGPIGQLCEQRNRNENPNSLFAQVMKAKYYPIDEFLNAKLGSYPLYTWLSIWNARTLLERGLGWKLGMMLL
ncbi:reverse transcriptase [Gossypium australe]|uniref:Reverse transcriptase n=1 Tax=Gossypium australe TaxID=47621 RepID=A0A5B6VCV4_9ROSI|nr:reverse transcriptase [Gossypium australe]